ncbi:MAG: FtsX-like permease family protein [Terriglobales bacterium]
MDTAEVGPDYFRASGTRLLQGRDFALAETAAGAPARVVINTVLARQFWPHGAALGRTLLFPGDKKHPSAGIVGIAATGKYRSLGEPPRPFAFVVRSLHSQAMLIARVADPADAFLAPVRLRLERLDPNLAASDIHTGATTMQFPLFPARFTGLLLAGFGLLALLLAVVGLYGVIAAAVAQRTREYGIRMALGASAPALLKRLVGQGMRLALWGVIAGAILALLVTRLMAGLLYGLSPADPASYLAPQPCCWGWRPWPASCLSAAPRAWTRSAPCGRSSSTLLVGAVSSQL